MKFKIETFSKDLDIYTVVSNTGEKKAVTAMQIVLVMLKGYEFINAKLTNKGFAIITNSGTRYIQVKGLTKQMLAQMHSITSNSNKNNQTVPNISGSKPSVHTKQHTENNNKPQIKNITIKKTASGSGSYLSGTPITVGGVSYRNAREMCAKHNRDFQLYNEMIKKGYTKEEALGIVTARPIDVVAKEKLKTAKVLDRLAYDRGEL